MITRMEKIEPEKTDSYMYLSHAYYILSCIY